MCWVEVAKRSGVLLLLLFTLAGITACGKKGPLYLPEKESAQQK